MTDGVAWVFPGQGSQEPGMGRDAFEASAAARRTFEQADAALGRSISRLCFEGTAEELGDTANSQPAIYTVSIAYLETAREAGILPDLPAYVAGHSLGEYSALTAAGALPFEDGVRLVETRGRLTQAAAAATPGKMAAMLGMDDGAAEALCADAGVEVANYNAPGQVVISGARDAVERACALALERGARRAVPLDVSGAFHSPLMAPAVAGMREALAAAAFRQPGATYVANDAARPLDDADAIREELAHQLTHPVRWVACVQYLASQGVRTLVEIGPGRVLSGLNKRIASGVETKNVNSMKAIAEWSASST